jgi:nicotinamidase-related amidase
MTIDVAKRFLDGVKEYPLQPQGHTHSPMVATLVARSHQHLIKVIHNAQVSHTGVLHC